MSDLSITNRTSTQDTPAAAPIAGDPASTAAAERVGEQIRDVVESMTGQVDLPAAPHTGTTSPSDQRRVRNQMVQARLSGPASERVKEGLRRSQPAFEVTGGFPVRTNGQIYEFRFDRPMSERDVAERLFQGGKLPTRIESGGRSGGDEIRLIPVGKTPTRAWRLDVPYSNAGSDRMNPGVWDTIDAGMARHSAKLPPWVPQASKQAILSKQPPKPGDRRFADVKSYPAPHQNVTTWREGNTVYWYDAGTGRAEGYREKSGRYSDTYNRDMRYYVQEQGLTPAEGERRFVEQWEQVNREMLGAFGLALDDRHGWEILLHGIVGHEGE